MEAEVGSGKGTCNAAATGRTAKNAAGEALDSVSVERIAMNIMRKYHDTLANKAFSSYHQFLIF